MSRGLWKALAVRVIVVAIFGMFTFKYFLIPIRMAGAEMNSWHKHLGFSFVNRMAYLFDTPDRGEMIAIRTTGTSLMYVKRILALPNEELLILAGTVFVNGKAVDPEIYRNADIPYQLGDFHLNHDEYFVIGHENSPDPRVREFGKVKSERIIGKVLF